MAEQTFSGIAFVDDQDIVAHLGLLPYRFVSPTADYIFYSICDFKTDYRYRGEGLGTKLLDAAIDKCEYLYCQSGSVESEPFYLKAGLEQDDNSAFVGLSLKLKPFRFHLAKQKNWKGLVKAGLALGRSNLRTGSSRVTVAPCSLTSATDGGNGTWVSGKTYLGLDHDPPFLTWLNSSPFGHLNAWSLRMGHDVVGHVIFRCDAGYSHPTIRYCRILFVDITEPDQAYGALSGFVAHAITEYDPVIIQAHLPAGSELVDAAIKLGFRIDYLKRPFLSRSILSMGHSVRFGYMEKDYIFRDTAGRLP